MTSLRLDAIRLDGGTQPRAALDPDVVDDYRVDMMAGAKFPPVTVFYDGADYWLADGFHRVKAAELAGVIELDADIRQGTRRDAILHSVGANADHGLRRTNADKRRAVMTLLNDEEWRELSDNQIAQRCGVSQPFVSRLRTYNGYKSDLRKGADGRTTNTANIGGRRPEPLTETEQAEQADLLRLDGELDELLSALPKHAAEMGKSLKAVKLVLDENLYRKWLQAEVNLTEETAARFIKVTDQYNAGQKPDLNEVLELIMESNPLLKGGDAVGG